MIDGIFSMNTAAKEMIYKTSPPKFVSGSFIESRLMLLFKEATGHTVNPVSTANRKTVLFTLPPPKQQQQQNTISLVKLTFGIMSRSTFLCPLIEANNNCVGMSFI